MVHIGLFSTLMAFIYHMTLLETKNGFMNAAKSENETDYGNYYQIKEEELRNNLSKDQVYLAKALVIFHHQLIKKLLILKT